MRSLDPQGVNTKSITLDQQHLNFVPKNSKELISN
jgi:hypothetical protein